MQSVTWLWKTNGKCDWGGFWLELLFAKIWFYLAIYMVLCVFHKIIVWFRSKFATREVAIFLSKKRFRLHLYSVSLLSTEKHIFWHKTCKVRLDYEKQMENAIGVDFGSRCFLPKFGFTPQFTWFCAFFIKSLFCFEGNLQQEKLQHFWQKKSPKMPP